MTQPTSPGQSPAGGASLRSAVAAMSPPPNPATPRVRTNVEMDHLITLNTALHSVNKGIDEEQDPILTQVLQTIKGTLQQMLLGRNAQAVMEYLQSATGGGPQAGAPASIGGAPGPMGAPPPGGMPMGAPPQSGAPGGPGAAMPPPPQAGGMNPSGGA